MPAGVPAEGPKPTPATGPAEALSSMADVLRMLDRLPLSDAERAEAVRRLISPP